MKLCPLSPLLECVTVHTCVVVSSGDLTRPCHTNGKDEYTFQDNSYEILCY